MVSEIFGPTIQGEGLLVGTPTVFVRTGGCDYRCRWCDTLYAVLPEHRNEWQRMSSEDVLGEVMHRSGGCPILVTITGGNPALQPLGPLLSEGHERGLTFALETQGSVAKSWFAQLDHLVLSPKPPSAGVVTDATSLAQCMETARHVKTLIKVVVFDDKDFLYAVGMHRTFPGLPFCLQLGNRPPFDERSHPDPVEFGRRFDWLMERVCAHGLHDVRVLPQVHVLLWGNKRGV